MTTVSGSHKCTDKCKTAGCSAVAAKQAKKEGCCSSEKKAETTVSMTKTSGSHKCTDDCKDGCKVATVDTEKHTCTDACKNGCTAKT